MREQRCNAATKPPSRQGRQRHCWYLYDVIFGGKVIVADSADPETDLARALMAQGIVGAVEIFDGRTGKPRSRVNIEAASKVTFREDRRRGPPDKLAVHLPLSMRACRQRGRSCGSPRPERSATMSKAETICRLLIGDLRRIFRHRNGEGR